MEEIAQLRCRRSRIPVNRDRRILQSQQCGEIDADEDGRSCRSDVSAVRCGGALFENLAVRGEHDPLSSTRRKQRVYERVCQTHAVRDGFGRCIEFGEILPQIRRCAVNDDAKACVGVHGEEPRAEQADAVFFVVYPHGSPALRTDTTVLAAIGVDLRDDPLGLAAKYLRVRTVRDQEQCRSDIGSLDLRHPFCCTGDGASLLFVHGTGSETCLHRRQRLLDDARGRQIAAHLGLAGPGRNRNLGDVGVVHGHAATVHRRE